MPDLLAYLGPPGTFTEAALRTLPESAAADTLPCPTVPDALDAVRDGRAAAAVVPLESSVEGAVPVTLDELAFGARPLLVAREVLLAVRPALLARPGTGLGDVAVVTSHPHALAQSRATLARLLPGAAVEAAASTADAARRAADTDGVAAVAAPEAAAALGLAVLADDVADHAGAVTRFVLVRRPGALPEPTGADRTSVVAFIADDHPGALLELLEQLAVRGVNLSRIESRPTKAGLGRYCFFLDVEGHVAEARVGDALAGLRRSCAGVRFLGSYPRADGPASPPPRGTSDADFADAAAWLAAVRRGETG